MYKKGNWGSEKVSDCYKVKQLLSSNVTEPGVQPNSESRELTCIKMLISWKGHSQKNKFMRLRWWGMGISDRLCHFMKKRDTVRPIKSQNVLYYLFLDTSSHQSNNLCKWFFSLNLIICLTIRICHFPLYLLLISFPSVLADKYYLRLLSRGKGAHA